MNCKYMATAILFLISFDCCAGVKDSMRKLRLILCKTKVEFFDPEKNRTIHGTFEIENHIDTIPVVVRTGGVNILTFARIPSEHNTDIPMKKIYFGLPDAHDKLGLELGFHNIESADGLEEGTLVFPCTIKRGSRRKIFTPVPIPMQNGESTRAMFARVKKEWDSDVFKFLSSKEELEKHPFRGVGLAWISPHDNDELFSSKY